MRKYHGFDNFDFEVVAELSPEEYTPEMLNELEKYFVKYYNSYENGYNATPGGDSNPLQQQKGEKNGRALLTRQDVEYIRECYNAHIPFRQIYNEYKDKISKRGLQKVWWFETWKDIYPEYHSPENKEWHSHQAKANTSEIASNNKKKFTDEEVRVMRDAYDNGMTPKQVWIQYGKTATWTTVYNIVTRNSYKNVK